MDLTSWCGRSPSDGQPYFQAEPCSRPNPHHSSTSDGRWPSSISQCHRWSVDSAGHIIDIDGLLPPDGPSLSTRWQNLWSDMYTRKRGTCTVGRGSREVLHAVRWFHGSDHRPGVTPLSTPPATFNGEAANLATRRRVSTASRRGTYPRPARALLRRPNSSLQVPEAGRRALGSRWR